MSVIPSPPRQVGTTVARMTSCYSRAISRRQTALKSTRYGAYKTPVVRVYKLESRVNPRINVDRQDEKVYAVKASYAMLRFICLLDMLAMLAQISGGILGR